MTEAAKAGQPALDFPVVCVGSSAGGLPALQKLFQAMPDQPEMAFVVIQHLDPERQSHLASILSNATTLPVLEVEPNTTVERNHVYVIVPDQLLTIEGGTLRVRPAGDRPRHPIDTFLISLAVDQRERAVAIILSGTGSNGAAGALRIKEEGGVIFAQDPASAGFDDMPRAAIASGAVDCVLPPEAMAAALVALASHPFLWRADNEQLPESGQAADLESILALINERSGNDFRGYKSSTLLRRVHRRMGLRHVEDMDRYSEMLAGDSSELEAMVRDILINVTSFFRDEKAWHALQSIVLAPLIESRSSRESIRVWVTACATGEEAYSVAMLLIEQAEAARKDIDIRVFATDAAAEGLARARAGVFPASIAESMPPDKLARFFDKEDDAYRVRKSVRERIIFSPQNLLSDPPFSRLDLVLCRNMLIYLEPSLQKRALSLFHFSLAEGGHLFLGSSETASGQQHFFETISKKWRIFRKVGSTRHDLIEFPSSNPLQVHRRELASLPAMRQVYGVAEIARQTLLARFAPASVLIDQNFQILFFHGNTDPFLRQPRGEPTRDLLRLARSGLISELRAVAQHVHDTGEQLTTTIEQESGAQFRSVTVDIVPVESGEQSDGRRLLISFRSRTDPDPAAPDPPAPAPNQDTELEQALDLSRQELRSTLTHLERSNEELQASNEEITSINEELQSMVEELETSKEELQSLNEELNSVNAQLSSKLDELENQTSDLNNLLNSSAIVTLFLDKDLNIKWFTPAVRELIDIVPTDIGRPISHFAPKFADGDFTEDARQVLRTLETLESEVLSNAGRWYLRRALPYRSEDDRIAGVAVTFTDITRRKQAEVANLESDQRFQALSEAAAQAVWTTDADGLAVRDSPSWRAFTGQTLEQWLGWGWLDAIHPEDREEVERQWHDAVESQSPITLEYRLWHAESGDWHPTLMRAAPLDRQNGWVRGWVAMSTDIAERRHAELRQRALVDELQHRVKNVFANINSLMSLSRRSSHDLDDFIERFGQRLAALERSQSLLGSRSGLGEGYDLRDIVMSELRAHGAEGRTSVAGASLPVNRGLAQAFGMVVHELATNAVKYGALAQQRGRIHISWTKMEGEQERLVFTWRETGVSISEPPSEAGFGSELIRNVVPYMVKGSTKLDFEADGVRCLVEALLVREE